MQNTSDAYYMYIKNAKVDWKTDFGTLTLGMQGMNVFNVAEKTWGHRFLEKSPMDFHKFSSSADMGVGYSGQFSIIYYSLMITNGSGYKNLENNKYKKISTQLVFGEKKLVKTDGYNAGLVYTIEPYSDTGKISVIRLFGGYAGNGLRVGGEFDMNIDSGDEVTEQIIATYASYKIFDNIEA